MQVSTTGDLVDAGGTTMLTATVSGTGAFSDAVTWAVEKGIGSLSATSGLSVTYQAPATATADSLVVVSATSVQDSSFRTQYTLGVTGECTLAQAVNCNFVIPFYCTTCSQGWQRCNHFACEGNACFAQACP